ncbi:MAG: hypothetical protein KF852_03220 [Saprospiraceae bacterium]|nr:hypothetical protein [Saprospiraceae bacterium]
MAAANTHIIHQQRILVRATDSRGGLDLQQAAGQTFWQRILPRLERLFDQYSSPQEVLRIERLEIDLGRCRSDELEAVLEKRFLEAMESELQRLSARPTGETGVEKQGMAESKFSQWLYFLEHGSLPWSAVSNLQASVFEETALLETLAATPLLKTLLRRLLRERPAARRRLVLQFGDAFVGGLAACLADAQAAAFLAPASALAQQMPKLYAAHPIFFAPSAIGVVQSSDLLRQLFWEFVLRRIARDETAFWQTTFPALLNGFLSPALAGNVLMPHPVASTPEDWLLQWSRAAVAAVDRIAGQQDESPPLVAPESETLTRPLMDTDSGSVPKTPSVEVDEKKTAASGSSKEADPFINTENVPTKVRRAIREELTKVTDTEILVEPAAAPALPADTASLSPNTNTGVFSAEEDALPADLRNALSVIDEAAPLHPDAEPSAGGVNYISFAGLVLLHPFFSTLFQTLGFTQEKAFVNFSAQVRAVHLLHFLAAGVEKAPEFQLLLPKVLCGLPLTAPIAQAVTLYENERAEAVALLEAAIRHWGALGNTSPDGLREGFLQREGKLEKRPDAWVLIVERRTIDILLNRLPWGLGMVKLPWMKEMLRVEWG